MESQSEFVTSLKPRASNWQLFVYSLQEIKDFIVDNKYNPSVEQEQIIKRLLKTNMEVVFGREN